MISQPPFSSVNPLAQPVGLLMREAATVEEGASLQVAAESMHGAISGCLPIVREGHLVAVLTEGALARALSEGRDLREDAGSVADHHYPTIAHYASGAEALRVLERAPYGSLIVVDDFGKVMGVVCASDLFAQKPLAVRPPMVGGMATPFGVYLTTGNLRAGVSDWALVTTGITMFLLIATGGILASFLVPLLHLPLRWVEPALQVFTFGLFMLGMRLIPLSGIHAAEHMVVHAIERGEELDPEIVSRMPRVHPRCGTNFAVAAGLFTGITFSEWTSDSSLRFLVGALTTFLLWRPLGSFMQYWVTTRPPSKKHLAMGIRSGEQILKVYSSTRHAKPNVFRRIWCMGLLQVMTGATLCMLAISLLGELLQLPFLKF